MIIMYFSKDLRKKLAACKLFWHKNFFSVKTITTFKHVFAIVHKKRKLHFHRKFFYLRYCKKLAALNAVTDKSIIVGFSQVVHFYGIKSIYSTKIVRSDLNPKSYIMNNQFTDTHILPASNIFKTRVDSYNYFIKLHDSTAYTFDMLAEVANLTKRTSETNIINWRRANSIFIGRFSRGGNLLRTSRLYAKAISFVFLHAKRLYSYIYRNSTKQSYIDLDFLNFMTTSSKDKTRIFNKFPFFKYKLNYNIFDDIFYKSQKSFSINSSAFFLRALYDIAPLYAYDPHRTDRKKYKNSKGHMPKWVANWRFIDKYERISFSMRILKFTWWFLKVNSYQSRFIMLLYQLTLYPRSTHVFRLGASAIRQLLIE